MDISIIVIGDELLIGQVTDTNSGWIARHVNPLGWNVKSVKVIGDNESEILKAIDEGFAQADLVLTTGGLGPTKDDITKEAMRKYFGGSMVYDTEVEKNVLEVVEKRHLKINDLTAAQAYVPSSCRVIQNRVGTAPIMWFEREGKVLVAMPGVPFETEQMMEREVIPQLMHHFCSDEHIMHRTFIVIDYSESALAMKLEQFENGIPESIHLAYLPRPGIIRLRLTGRSADGDKLAADMDRLSSQLHDLLGNSIISYEDKPVAAILGDMLRERNLTVSTAESCTGGNIAHEITEIAGSSDYYVGSVVSYSNEVKQSVLGVSPSVLAAEGAVSKPVVEQMCRGVGALLHTQCSIATSGIAGPGGGSLEKPVGTVWICVQCGEKQVAERCHFPGTRDRVIDRATMTGMLMLIKLLRS
ncbi:MAG TPA: CinA family nicotinamide mononucleotide deamidase-related protein [Candidatus Avimuribaculum pullicola]|nr:CinA family nicotinamide mononucleotide deamidase-related protein [Candidatus Avimuribaculum pullicola]